MVDSREPSEYPKQSEIKTRDEILSVGCDIFIPAAKEGTITEDNQKILNTKIICEGANGPLTSRADHYLNERGILIIPDLYANAGGVAVSYFEWVRNLSHMRFGRMQKRETEKHSLNLIEVMEKLTGKKIPKELLEKITEGPSEISLVRSGLDDTMREGYREISKKWNSDKLIDDFRTSAMVIAIEKIAKDYNSIGI